MKFLVLNSSGNVGKTTITSEVLSACMPTKIIEIETVNASSSNFESLDVEKIDTLENFENIYLKIIENENLVVDVGASILSSFLDKVSEFAGVEMLFDFFVIPTVAGDKVMTDTARTILYLKEKGIPNEQIKVIFNKGNSIADFELLIKQSKKLDYTFDESLFVPNSELFTTLGLLKKTIGDIWNPDVDSYKQAILKAEPKDKMKLIKTDLANRMAVSLRPKLKAVFENLTGGKLK